MKRKLILFFAWVLQTLSAIEVFSHPGSGIIVDKNGNIYFTDTGKGVCKIDLQGRLTYLTTSRYHWMAIDEAGYFADTQRNFGDFFERVTPQGAKPVVIICPEFPFTIGTDGNIYYADTRHSPGKIMRRTPDGKVTVLVSDKAFQSIHGVTSGTDGSLYITEASNPNANTIRKVTMAGTVSIVATYVGKKINNPPLETTPSYCRGLSVDSLGNIYVAVTGSRSILKITPRGEITSILRESGSWAVTGVTVSKGEVYMLEWHDVAVENLEVREAWIPRVRKLGRSGKVTTVADVSR